MNNQDYGTLYLCATPIGNLEDISLRALRILKEASLIAAEDTRHTAKLLNYFEIKTPLTSYHEHNKRGKGSVLIEKLKSGQDVALVTDAGMPAVSDPGEDIVRLCIEEGVPVTCVPGASAVLAALSLSGLSTRSFAFEGFLPHTKKERRLALSRVESEERTLILYESPHKLIPTLKELAEIAGERKISVARELTKLHEEIVRGTFADITAYFEQNEPRGEFVLIIEGMKKNENFTDTDPAALARSYMDSGLSEMDAIKQAAKDLGLPKREVYARVHDIVK